MSARFGVTRVVRGGRDAVAGTVARLRGAPRAAPAKALQRVGASAGASELRRRRDRLARQLAELQWDLGGLTYEMAIRDHFRVDVLVRVAAQLQTVDVELAETERLLRLDEAGAAGACSTCGALHARGAAFCWRCGTALLTASKPSSPTSVSVITATDAPPSTGAGPA